MYVRKLGSLSKYVTTRRAHGRKYVRREKAHGASMSGARRPWSKYDRSKKAHGESMSGEREKMAGPEKMHFLKMI